MSASHMARADDRYPVATPQAILEQLKVSDAGRGDQLAAVADAAYGGRLSLGALRVMRTTGFLPYDVTRPEAEPEE